VFKFLQEYRQDARGNRPFLIGVIIKPLQSDKLKNPEFVNNFETPFSMKLGLRSIRSITPFRGIDPYCWR
jgi:hypothetical protein